MSSIPDVVLNDIRIATKNVICASIAMRMLPALDVLYSERRKTYTFYVNRSQILDAFKDDRLYVIDIYGEGESGERLRNWMDDTYDTNFYLPAFCVLSKDKTTVEYLWVHAPLRGLGFGRMFIEVLKPQKAQDALKQSTGFWDKMHVEYNVYRPIKKQRRSKADDG